MKAISIDAKAYSLLDQAKRFPSESFSEVIKRARWDSDAGARTCGDVLLTATATIPEFALERLDEEQSSSSFPS
ncbi:MAG: hypothetical protein JNJ70_01915 [Verrucomicrobiales bacterium]|nr:hypothetical protein [Verrucomicrobiales bacterium]